MDPITLGLLAAGIVAKKALETTGDKAAETVWASLQTVGDRVRSWFSDNDDDPGTKALEVVEAAPDSQRAVETLADSIANAIGADRSFGDELAALVETAERGGSAPVASFVTEVRDNAKVGRIIQVQNGNYYERGSN